MTTINVLANDNDPDGDAPTLAEFTQGAHDKVELVPDTPNANYNGSDSFTYSMSDERDGPAVGGVTIIIKPVNNPPDVNAGEQYQAEKVGAKASVSLADAGASDLDGGALSYHWTSTAPGVKFNPDAAAIQPPLTFDASGGLGTEYEVALEASDAKATTIAKTTARIADTRPPEIKRLGINPLIHEGGTPFIDPGATADDAADGVFAAIADASDVKPNVPGCTITYSAWDKAGTQPSPPARSRWSAP